MWAMKKVGFTLIGIVLLAPQAPALPDRPAPGTPAKTTVVVVVPGTVEPFQNRQLEVVLHEYDPRFKEKETVIDSHVNKGFGHAKGADSTIRLTLGANAMMKPAMHYYVTADVLQSGGKRMLIGEKDGKRQIYNLRTDGIANQVTMIFRKAKPQDIVLDIADEIRKGNNAKATKLAKARTNDFEDFYEVMNFFRPRTKGGMGWGATPGKIPQQDALENRLLVLGRMLPMNFLEDEKSNEEAATWIAAIAELASAKEFDFRPMGKKNKADFQKKAAALRAEADGFARAIAQKNAAAIQQSARSVMQACYQCHEIYRD